MSVNAEPELNSVHSVKILLCYVLDRLSSVCSEITEEQLRQISDESGVINYFFFSDALDELVSNGSVSAKTDDSGSRIISLNEKGRLGSDYFNMSIPLVFRKKLLQSAFSYFLKIKRRDNFIVEVSELQMGCNVRFVIKDKEFDLINMTFYAPDREQAELIAERIRSNPEGAYSGILNLLLNTKEETIDVEKYL
ncbi:MAG: DUF4364 family protein [Huintestinicola sp.]